MAAYDDDDDDDDDGKKKRGGMAGWKHPSWHVPARTTYLPTYVLSHSALLIFSVTLQYTTPPFFLQSIDGRDVYRESCQALTQVNEQTFKQVNKQVSPTLTTTSRDEPR